MIGHSVGYVLLHNHPGMRIQVHGISLGSGQAVNDGQCACPMVVAKFAVLYEQMCTD